MASHMSRSTYVSLVLLVSIAKQCLSVCPEPFKINRLPNPAPEGYRRATKDEVREDMDKVKDCLEVHGEWAILALADGKIMGSGYYYSFEDNDGGAGSELLIFGSNDVESSQGLSDCAGPFSINHLDYPTPQGYRRPTYAEAWENSEDVKDCLDDHGEWAILALADGKVMGSGYSYSYEDNDGGAGSELLVQVNDDTPAPTSSVTSSVSGMVKADDQLLSLYINGDLMAGVVTEGHKSVANFTITSEPRVIAISVDNWRPGGWSGVFGYFEGLVTSGDGWRCIDANEIKLEGSWWGIDFDDSAWPQAVETGEVELWENQIVHQIGTSSFHGGVSEFICRYSQSSE